MKLLLDQNLSFKLIPSLRDDFPESCHVKDLEMTAADDEVVWAVAIERGFAIVSKDADFLHRSLLRGQPPKVIQLRLGNCSSRHILETLHRKRAVIQDFLCHPEEALLIID